MTLVSGGSFLALGSVHSGFSFHPLNALLSLCLPRLINNCFVGYRKISEQQTSRVLSSTPTQMTGSTKCRAALECPAGVVSTDPSMIHFHSPIPTRIKPSLGHSRSLVRILGATKELSPRNPSLFSQRDHLIIADPYSAKAPLSFTVYLHKIETAAVGSWKLSVSFSYGRSIGTVTGSYI